MINRFFAEMKRELAEMKKYKFNLIFANISLLILFYSLLKKFKLGNGAVSFFMFVCWYFATHGLSNPTYILEDEIMDRTIVSIVQSDKSVLSVLYSRNLLQIMLDLIKAIPLFLFLFFICDIDFGLAGTLNFIFIIVSILLAVVNCYSIGISFSVLAILNHRAGSFIGIFDYFILFFGGIAAEPGTSFISKILNVLLPFSNLRDIIETSVLGEYNLYAFLSLIIRLLIWHFISILIFKKCFYHAVKRGEIYEI